MSTNRAKKEKYINKRHITGPKKKDDYKQRRMKARRESKPKKIRRNVNKQGKERKKHHTSYTLQKNDQIPSPNLEKPRNQNSRLSFEISQEKEKGKCKITKLKKETKRSLR